MYMLGWVIGVPAFLMLLVLLLDQLEARIVRPIDRWVKIASIVELTSEPDEVERSVAALLEPAVAELALPRPVPPRSPTVRPAAS